MVQQEQILKLKEQIVAEFRKNDTLHAEFIIFEENQNKNLLRVKDSMGWFTIDTLKWLDEKYKAGVVFGSDFVTAEPIPYVIVE